MDLKEYGSIDIIPIENLENRKDIKISPKYILDNFYNRQTLIEPESHVNEFKANYIRDCSITAICPYTGKKVYSNNSYYTHNFIWYEFSSNKNIFYLLFLNKIPKKGNSLCILMLEDKQIAFGAPIILEDRFNKILKKEYSQLKTFLNKNANAVLKYRKSKKQATLILPNTMNSIFHFFWNEICGVEYALENNLGDKINKVVVTKKHFDFKELFPEILKDKILYIDSDTDIQETIINNNLFVVHLADNTIRQKTLNRIRKYSNKRVSDDFKNSFNDFKDKHEILIAIGLRAEMGKSWSDEEQGTIALINKLLDKYPTIGVILNGFSKSNPLDTLKPRITKSQKKLTRTITSKVIDKSRILDTTTCTLPETIFMAPHISTYLAAHGSQQHKWGWFGNKPGVVHGPRARMESVERNFQTKKILDQAAYKIPNPIFLLPIPSSKTVDDPLQQKLHWNPRACHYNFDWNLAYDRLDFIISNLKDNLNRSTEDWNKLMFEYYRENY